MERPDVTPCAAGRATDGGAAEARLDGSKIEIAERRQRLAEVLEEASREGEVQIRRQDGRVYAVTPVAQSAAATRGATHIGRRTR
jgi:hypothetical protein